MNIRCRFLNRTNTRHASAGCNQWRQPMDNNDDTRVCSICERVYRVSRYGDWCPDCGAIGKDGWIVPKQMVEFLNIEI
jgi:hypothetical protein